MVPWCGKLTPYHAVPTVASGNTANIYLLEVAMFAYFIYLPTFFLIYARFYIR